METNLRNSDTTHTPKFKSYYVVWKQLCCERNTNANNSFKSYYVVWKRGIPEFLLTGDTKFKSYYVVWKQSIPCEEWFNVFGLNRTM